MLWKLNIKNTSNYKYFVVVKYKGLEPAAPWFEQTKEEHRMNREDAAFVDVIHTNSGLLIQVKFLAY